MTSTAAPSGTRSADELAGRRMLGARPVWTGMDVARRVTGLNRTLLHAGPPFAAWAQVPVPVRNSMALACLYEGWATTVDNALAALADGLVDFAPAQDHGVVVPLAGVVSPSMAVHVIGDANSDRVAYAVVNEGMAHCLRLGTLDPHTPVHHRWLNGPFAAWLEAAVTAPVDLFPLISASLEQGDDGHSRTVAGSRLVADLLTGDARVGRDTPAEVAAFLGDSPALALNLWMGAAALVLGAAEGVAGSSVVSRAGGNGVDFGVQVAGRPGRWVTVTGTTPSGPVEAAHVGRRAVGAIGDSAVVDMLGLGGQSLASAPAVRAALADHLPADALQRPAALLPLPIPGAGRLHTGLSAARVTDTGTAPLVLLGMISETGHGRIGGGVYTPPVSLFEAAHST